MWAYGFSLIRESANAVSSLTRDCLLSDGETSYDSISRQDAMHELSLMDGLAARVLAVASEQQAERVVQIQLRIGSLAGVDPAALRFAAEVVFAGTCAAGATLVIEEIAAASWCVACATEFLAPEGRQDCPICGALSSRLLRGRELSLVSVELVP